MSIINLILILHFIELNHMEIIFSPRYIIDDKYPFIINYPNNEYYYIIASKKDIKAKKENGNIIIQSHNFEFSNETIYCVDKYNNVHLFHPQKFYTIVINNVDDHFISIYETSSSPFNFNYFGSITLNYLFGIYGININKFVFFKKEDSVIFEYNVVGIRKISCKLLGEQNFVCAAIIDNKYQIYLFNFDHNNDNYFCITCEKKDTNEYLNLALYDTTSVNTKILCQNFNNILICHFIQLTLLSTAPISGMLKEIGNQNLTFILGSNDFYERDCNFFQFNGEYLFCCGIKNSIICYRIKKSNYSIIKKFNIPINQRNSYLSIITYSIWAIFVFMNNEDKVYEYRIYVPNCNNKEYSIFDILIENKKNLSLGRLEYLFEVKTNNIFLKFDNAPYDFGYFLLNQNTTIDNSNYINILNNDYSIDFIITNKGKINFTIIDINYTVSVEHSEAYTNQCYIKFNFPSIPCFNSCETCYINIYGSNNTNHNCIICKDNYYPSPIIKTNCYMKNETEKNWYFEPSQKIFDLCDKECESCSGPLNNQCLSCKNGSYLYSGSCSHQCPEGYFAELINDIDNYYYNCSECYETCKTCLDKEKGNSTNMKCITCKINHIKYKNNCYQIENEIKKSFYDPEYNNESSCYEKFNLYIKEESNECIELPEKDEGYYISNNITGLLLKCHENCLSCNNSIITDSSTNLISMECLSCKDNNNINKTMIHFENNCFKIIQYDENKIIFNITEINSNVTGSCLYFNKSIYYGQYNCIDKPENTYFF